MIEEQSDNPSQKQYTGQRSPGLTLICILTFIGSGLSAIAFFTIYLAYNDIQLLAMEDNFAMTKQQLVEMIKSVSRSFFITMTLLYITSLIGSIMMWKLFKKGFHVYTLAQLLMLLVPFFMIKGYTVPLPNALITAVFIAAYALHANEMR